MINKEPRRVTFVELGKHTTGTFGHPNLTEPLDKLLNDPPLSNGRTECDLLAMLVYQQSALIDQQSTMMHLIATAVTEIAGLRRDINSEQTRVEAAREKAAKAEEKAAIARERAAQAEASVKPPNVTVIQAGGDLRQIDDRIARKF